MKKVIALSVLSALLLSAMLLSSCISKAPEASTSSTEGKLEVEPLSDKHSAQIVKEYTKYMKENEKYDPDMYGEFYIEEYCGTYNSADIVVFGGGMEYDGDGEVRLIAGVRLQYDGGKSILAYRRGDIYTLEELYSKKLLDRDDFAAIAEIHNKREFEIDSLSEELYQQIINDYTTRMQTENNYDPDKYLPFEVIEYCGTYNGAVAVMLDGGGLGYSAVIVVDEVAGESIHYGSSNHIWLWKDGDFLTVKEAYEQGVLTADNVAEIAGIHNGGRYYDIVKDPADAIVTLDEATQSEIESAFERKGYPLTWFDIEAADAQISEGVRCYGNFEGCIVLFEPTQLASETTMIIGDSGFAYSSSFALWGYYDGVLYTLDEAFSNGYLSNDEVAVVAERHRTVQRYINAEK